MPRYVILRHETPDGHDRSAHWDFMLEVDDALLTWALDREPVGGQPMEADRLPDHRKVYLDYEGPISGGRGSVTQWTCGEYTLVEHHADSIVAHLQTGNIAGTALLEHIDGQRWMITLSKASTAADCSTPDEPDGGATPLTSPDK